MKEGNQAILNYFESLESEGEETVYEAKLLIIGEAGTGKTTLARKLQDPYAPMPEEVKDTTCGIDIQPHVFNGKGEEADFTMNLWDFGGQEIYHSTHQFFLSKRSLYILLADGRLEENLDYWLQVQELLGEDSPLFIVHNQKGTIRQQLPIHELRSHYPNLLDWHLINLKEDIPGITQLTTEVEHRIRNLPHLQKGEKLPRTWVGVREKLEEIEEPYILLRDFRNVCKAVGIKNRKKQDFLSDYLHDLGALLHFCDVPILRNIVILKPEWATEAVYKVLDHTKAQVVAGHFHRRDLDTIWGSEEYEDVFDELLALMERFELCYPLPEDKDQFIVPQLLPGDQPEHYTWENHQNLQLRYQYDFLPKGIVTRFIVRMHRYIEDQAKVWKRGVVLTYRNTLAEVLEKPRDKRIEVRIRGPHRRDLMTLIVKDLDELNETFHFNERMGVEKLIPCNCRECKDALQPHFYTQHNLLQKKGTGKRYVECDNSYEDVEVLQLVDDVLNKELNVGKKRKSILRAFISYSKHDRHYVEKFITHFAPLKNTEKLILWEDHQLVPGEEWDDRIRQELRKAEIIFMLVSPHALATDYIQNIEQTFAMEQHEQGLAIVVPILLRPCGWQDTELTALSALPYKGHPIASWKTHTRWATEDDAWQEVYEGVKRLIERWG